MKKTEFDARMRELEYFHSLRIPPRTWAVLRVDGRKFSKHTEQMEKPFDEDFHLRMVHTADALLRDFNGVYGHSHSDEISILLNREFDLFDREVEKLVSTSAAIASAYYTFNLVKSDNLVRSPQTFDSRIVICPTDRDVLDYFSWRQDDAARNALNSWSYWTLRKEGRTKQEATKLLSKASVSDKNELLFQRGINFDAVPLWQKRGAGLYFKNYDHWGYNPKTNEKVATTRRDIFWDEQLETKEEYRKFIAGLCGMYWYLELPD